MKEFKGKPGPWHWEGKVLCNDAHIVGGDGWTFSDADKSLIAAAPELLDALQCIVEACAWGTYGNPGYENLEAAKAAIKKALGE